MCTWLQRSSDRLRDVMYWLLQAEVLSEAGAGAAAGAGRTTGQRWQRRR